jgi:RNA polymerase sigma-70 factor, ECF subfamily
MGDREGTAGSTGAAQAAVQDALLLERVRRGDEAAASELVRRHMGRAFSIAFRILEHREDAEDVVQESFMRAFERLDTLERARPFHPWFHRIVVNQALNYRRGRSVRRTEQIPVNAPSTAPSPAADAERAELRSRLREAAELLPERQRLIVQLFDLEGLASGEIGEILGMAEGTVRWHLHQARRVLREALEPLKKEET